MFFFLSYTFYSWACLLIIMHSFKWKPHCVRWSHFFLFLYIYLERWQVNTDSFKSFLWLNVNHMVMLQNFNWAAIEALTASDLASYTFINLKTKDCFVCSHKDWTLLYLIPNLVFRPQAQGKGNGNGCTLCIASTQLQQAYHLLNISSRIASSLISLGTVSKGSVNFEHSGHIRLHSGSICLFHSCGVAACRNYCFDFLYCLFVIVDLPLSACLLRRQELQAATGCRGRDKEHKPSSFYSSPWADTRSFTAYMHLQSYAHILDVQ